MKENRKEIPEKGNRGKGSQKRDTYPGPQSQDTPTNQSRGSIIQIPPKLHNQKDKGGTQPTNRPSHQTSKHQNGTESQCLFPCWPIEWIVDIVAGLRDQYDIRISLVFELMGR